MKLVFFQKYLQKMMRFKLVKILLITVLIVVIGIVIINNLGNNYNRNNFIVNNNISDFEEGMIRVYLSGEVNYEGMYKFSNGITLEECLSKIGGITSNANYDIIDLNMKLKDGEKIVIPSKGLEIYDLEENLSKEDSEKIDINTASKQQLMNIDGIGEVTAENIIEYRTNNKFKSIEELLNVSGIGEAKYENMKAYLIIK